ncbi:MAG: apolipoprotein N-acyltransferase [Planctomycetaceae bacterium]
MTGGGAIAAVGTAVFLAAPWVDQRLAACGLGGATIAVLLAAGRRGWRHEAAVLLGAVVALAIAFHWAPAAVADVLGSSRAAGLAFVAPILAWDACRLALPLCVAGRLARDPRSAWLPAALGAVAAEELLPAVFPWKIGSFQAAWPVVMQSADLLGAEAPTFAAFATAGALLVVLGPVVGLEYRRVPAAGIAAVVITLANLGYGLWSLHHWTRLAAEAPTIRLAAVQVDPAAGAGLDELRRLTRAACADSRVDLACWPECSGGAYEDGLDSFADEEEVFRRSRPPLRGLRPCPAPPCPILCGGAVYRGYPEKPREIHQAALLINRREQLVGVYRKRHLMPFGEYVPFATLFPELRLHFPVATEYDVGSGAEVLPSGAARLGVLLCYEDMLPAAAAELVASSANVLVSLIDASAFADPLTLAQHRLLAQGRAVELRRCLVRCGSTGETCVITPVGTVERRLPAQSPGWLVVDVPLLEGRTLASRIGPVFPVACGIAVGGVPLARRFRRAATA